MVFQELVHGMQVQAQRAEWDARRASGSTERVQLTLEGEAVSVLPLWVAVHQERTAGLARWAIN